MISTYSQEHFCKIKAMDNVAFTIANTFMKENVIIEFMNRKYSRGKLDSINMGQLKFLSK